MIVCCALCGYRPSRQGACVGYGCPAAIHTPQGNFTIRCTACAGRIAAVWGLRLAVVKAFPCVL
jgi:hypothetical protein